MATLCIDAGTTLIKAVIFDELGNEISISSANTSVLKPELFQSEQDMNEVWDTVVEVSREAIALAGDEHPVLKIAITAQGDGAWIIDEDGNPVRNAILWNDGRAASEVQHWADRGVLESAFQINGSLTSLGLPNAIIANLKKTEPSVLAEGNKILTCGSWIFYKFTHRIGLHISDASAPWIDINSGKISDELFDLYGLSEFRSLVPDVFEQSDTTCEITSDVAEELGISRVTVVTLAPYDIVSTATGSGLIEAGQAYAILGTTLCPGVLVPSPQITSASVGLNLKSNTDREYLRAFPTLTGAGTFDWICSILDVNLEELTLLAASSPAGANGVIVLPYFSPAGERAPFLNTRASGTILGANFQTSKADIARACFESLAHVVKECLEVANISPTSIALSGGGARNELMCQIIADVTGVIATRSLDKQVGTKGALMYSAVATGDVDSLEMAKERYLRSGETYIPTQEVGATYSNSYSQFLNARNALLGTIWI